MTRPKASDRLFPNFLAGAVSVGEERLHQIAEATQIDVGDLKKSDLIAIARRLLHRLPDTAFFLHHVTHDDETRMAAALGLPDENTWNRANPVTDAIAAMEDYEKPSWQKDLWSAFRKKAELPPPVPRTNIHRDPQFAKQWPELSSSRSWKTLSPTDKIRISAELARALGKNFAKGLGEECMVVHVPSAVEYVAVPGGKVSIGLSKEELTAIRKVMKGDPEGVELLKGYVRQVRPEHDTRIPAFLCARTPFLKAHVKKSGLAQDADCANVHQVARMAGERAAALVTKIKARLLTEAEWEWVARADGARQWVVGVVGGESPGDGIDALSTDPAMTKDLHPWGVAGLAWGTWVDDGWQPTYKNAPLDGSAYAPMTIPEVVRGGGLASWPWQSPGEALMSHVTFRDLDRSGDQAVRLALDLPARKS